METRHIVNVSGHKSETSIKSYSRNVSESKKHEMCTVLHSVLNPVSENLLLLSKEAITDNLVFETDQVQEVNEAEFLSNILDQPDTMHMATNIINKENLEINNLVNVSVRPVSTKFNNIHQVHIHYHN